MSAAKSRASGLSVGKNSTMQSQSFSPSHLASRARNHLCASFPTSQITLFDSFGAKLAVQERYNQSLFHRAISRSLQGVAERPLPCNYNVIQPISALSRR